MEAYDAESVRRLREQLGFAKFADRLRSDPALKAAFEVMRAEAVEVERGHDEDCAPVNVWRVATDGRGLPIVRIPVGAKHVVRAVGELVTVTRHWLGDGNSLICFGKTCKVCPANGQRDGYFDAIFSRRVGYEGQLEWFRGIAAVPAAAVEAIEGRVLRGLRLSFYRKAARAKTIVGVVEEACQFDLPPAIDVRTPLMRLWSLPSWPGEAEQADPNILKFRKQA